MANNESLPSYWRKLSFFLKKKKKIIIYIEACESYTESCSIIDGYRVDRTWS